MNPLNLLGYAFPSASRAMHPELYPETDADLAAANALLVAQWRRRAAAPAAPGGRAPPPPGVALGPISSSRDVAELRGLLNACLPVKYPDGSTLLLGATAAAESRLCVLFHRVDSILYLFAHEADPLWATDGIEYMSQVTAPQENLELTGCLDFLEKRLAAASGAAARRRAGAAAGAPGDDARGAALVEEEGPAQLPLARRAAALAEEHRLDARQGSHRAVAAAKAPARRAGQLAAAHLEHTWHSRSRVEEVKPTALSRTYLARGCRE